MAATEPAGPSAMAGPFDLSGPHPAPPAGARARELVILLHGYGADGRDLIGLAPHMRRALPHAAFVAPNAPFPCEAGAYGYQWFSFADRDPAMLLGGVQAAAAVLAGFLA